jgi:hypothetical protein
VQKVGQQDDQKLKRQPEIENTTKKKQETKI